MYLLDTNICIALNNQNNQALTTFYKKSSECYIPTIVIAELYKGAYCSQRIEQNINRINQGACVPGDLKKYRHIEYGGWWCNGIEPLNNYNPMMWGCFKPDKPRRDYEKIHKFIKYEHPYKEVTRAFFLQVPKRIWEKVAERYSIPIAEDDLQHPHGFWYWVWRRNVPVVIRHLRNSNILW